MEMASIIQLKPDSTFQFLYSYGAVDRYGAGKWSMKNNSRERPTLDFKLISSKRVNNKLTTIKTSDKNQNLLSYVLCIVKNKDGSHEQVTNGEGIAQLPIEALDSISLLFELCRDRNSAFHVSNDDNYFEFGFEAWIAKYSFSTFKIKIDGGKLVGKHPLMLGENFTYIKE
jgi:hypothetical protein